jgi:hypothetical protein
MSPHGITASCNGRRSAPPLKTRSVMPLGEEGWAPLPREEVSRENHLVIMVVQGLCGMMTANFLAVAVEATSEVSGTVFFALKEESPQDREEIEEFVGECAALDWDIKITTVVWIGRDWVQGGWPGLGKRLVYSQRMG